MYLSVVPNRLAQIWLCHLIVFSQLSVYGRLVFCQSLWELIGKLIPTSDVSNPRLSYLPRTWCSDSSSPSCRVSPTTCSRIHPPSTRGICMVLTCCRTSTFDPSMHACMLEIQKPSSVDTTHFYLSILVVGHHLWGALRGTCLPVRLWKLCMWQHTPHSFHDSSVHPLCKPIQLRNLRHFIS